MDERQIQERIDRLEEELRRLLPGVRLKWVRCGKMGCWCARAGKGHGPYYYRYRWHSEEPNSRGGKGRQVEVYLGKNLAEEGHPSTWRQLRRIAKEISRLQRLKEELLTQEADL